jgi:hypothetical protein
MLNLVQSPASKFRLVCTEIGGAFGAGVMLILTLIFWHDTNAEHKMAELILNASQAKGAQQSKQAQEAEAPISQAELAELKARVMYLSRRQVEREDLTDVQHILLKKRVSQTGSTAQLQSLQWRTGVLEMDAISESPADWYSLTNDLALFDRWKTAPQVFQVHHAVDKAPNDKAPNNMVQSHGLSQVAFKFKAHLWANSTNPATLPASKSAP